MRRSLSLTAYQAWSRRAEPRNAKEYPPRPGGKVVWLHAAEPGGLLAVNDLAHRLCSVETHVTVLLTVPQASMLEEIQGGYDRHETNVKPVEAPSEHPDDVRCFLDHWSPSVCLWAWGNMRPNLIHQALEQNCQMALIDGDTGGFDGKLNRWLPEVARHLLNDFSALMVRSEPAAQRLANLGVERGRIEINAPLQPGGQALPCNTAELDHMSALLAGRPVWLATGVQPGELDTVLEAHRSALRFSHRLLLILTPAPELSARRCLEACAETGFRATDWGEGVEPDDATQVMVADDLQDLGLFYRLAPIAFLGSSLDAHDSGLNPFEAAALGAAILCGPNVRRYRPHYRRLEQAGAARIVRNPEELAAAVARLIAPSEAAAMAHAGWDVISLGAQQTDRIIEFVQAAIDLPLEVM